jgi:lipoprotein-releasing system permease protein
MPWYLYLALKQLFPTGRKFPFFTAISVLGVALGVALLVVTISVMGGFGYQIRRMIVDTQGDVQVRGPGLIENPAELLPVLARVPGVTGITPFAEGTVMLKFHDKPVFPVIQGVDLQRVDSVIPLDHYLREGTLDDLDDDTIILSSQLAYGIGAGIGDRVEVYSPLQVERIEHDEVFFPRELRVAGIFEIGHQALDSNTVIVTLRRMQDLYGLGRAVHGFSLKLAPGEDPDAAAARINAALPPGTNATARSWMEFNRDFLFVLQLEKSLIFLLLLVIIVVAAFSVTSSLLIAVVRKTREIGLLGALGGRPREVAACFCLQGLVIGLAGTLVGLGLGFGFLAVRNHIVQFLIRLTDSEQAMRRFYQFSQLPSHLERRDLVLIVTSSVVISTLAGLLPAWRAARLKPVEALRSE